MFGHTPPDDQHYLATKIILYVRDQLPIEKISGVVTTNDQPNFNNVLKEMTPEERSVLRAFLEGRLNKRGFLSFNSAIKSSYGWGSMVGFATLMTSPYVIALYSVTAGLLFALDQYSHQAIIKERADNILNELNDLFPDEIPAHNNDVNNDDAGSFWNKFRFHQTKPLSTQAPTDDSDLKCKKQL